MNTNKKRRVAEDVSILWFRHGLRVHDNPSLVAATKDSSLLFMPIFIFDGESAGKFDHCIIVLSIHE